MKTLEEAIGCWTVNPDYTGLPKLAKAVSEAARWCRSSTLAKANDPSRLKRDLEILRKRVDTMLEVTVSAQRRLQQIIDTDELNRQEAF